MKNKIDPTLLTSNIHKFRRKSKLRATLPDKLSDLVQLAITDARAVLRHSGYLDMGGWTSTMPGDFRNTGPNCVPCLAGSVMLRSLEKAARTPGYYDADTEKKLCALNEFRLGNLTSALAFMPNTPEKIKVLEERCHNLGVSEILGGVEVPTLTGSVRGQEFELWSKQTKLVLEKLREAGL